MLWGTTATQLQKIIDYLANSDGVQTQFKYGCKEQPMKGLTNKGLNQFTMTHWSYDPRPSAQLV